VLPNGSAFLLRRTKEEARSAPHLEVGSAQRTP